MRLGDFKQKGSNSIFAGASLGWTKGGIGEPLIARSASLSPLALADELESGLVGRRTNQPTEPLLPFYLRRSNAGQWIIIGPVRVNHLKKAFTGQRGMGT